MKVTEFFIGFGPRIWSFRRGETEYGVKAIPAGAYVRIIGMNNLDEVAARRRGPDLPPEVLPPAHVGRRRRLDHALPDGLRPRHRSLVLFGSVTEDDSNWDDRPGVHRRGDADRLPRRRADPQPDPSARGRRDARAGGRASRRATASSPPTVRRSTTYAEMRDFTLAHPGDEVVLVIERGDETVEATVVLAERRAGRRDGRVPRRRRTRRSLERMGPVERCRPRPRRSAR